MTSAIEPLDRGSTTQRRRPGDGADRVFDTLAAEIVSGALAEGDKLSEPEIARRFGMSRAPIREALRRLEAKRLVVRLPNMGSRVAGFSADELIELYFLREALEGMAARLAATHASESQLDEAARILDAQQGAWDSREAGEMGYRATNIAFHRLVAAASGNAALAAALQDDAHQVSRVWRRVHKQFPMRGQEAIDDHRWILRALRARDGDLAEMAMRRHVAATRRSYEAILNAEREAG